MNRRHRCGRSCRLEHARSACARSRWGVHQGGSQRPLPSPGRPEARRHRGFLHGRHRFVPALDTRSSGATSRFLPTTASTTRSVQPEPLARTRAPRAAARRARSRRAGRRSSWRCEPSSKTSATVAVVSLPTRDYVFFLVERDELAAAVDMAARGQSVGWQPVLVPPQPPCGGSSTRSLGRGSSYRSASRRRRAAWPRSAQRRYGLRLSRRSRTASGPSGVELVSPRGGSESRL